MQALSYNTRIAGLRNDGRVQRLAPGSASLTMHNGDKKPRFSVTMKSSTKSSLAETLA